MLGFGSVTRELKSVDSGTVHSVLLNGMYRVGFDGRETVAFSQAGQLSAGQQVVMANTSAGLVVVSPGQQTATNYLEVTIDG